MFNAYQGSRPGSESNKLSLKEFLEIESKSIDEHLDSDSEIKTTDETAIELNLKEFLEIESKSIDEHLDSDSEIKTTDEKAISSKQLLRFFEATSNTISKFDRSKYKTLKVRGKFFNGHEYPAELKPLYKLMNDIIHLRKEIKAKEESPSEEAKDRLPDFKENLIQLLSEYKIKVIQYIYEHLDSPYSPYAKEMQAALAAEPHTRYDIGGTKTLPIQMCPLSKDLKRGDIIVFIELKNDPNQKNRPSLLGPRIIPPLQSAVAPSSSKHFSPQHGGVAVRYGHASEVHVAIVCEHHRDGRVRLAESADFGQVRSSYLDNRLRDQPAEIFRFKNLQLREQTALSAEFFIKKDKLRWGNPHEALRKRLMKQHVSLLEVESIDKHELEARTGKLLCVQFANLVITHALSELKINTAVPKIDGLMTKDFTSWLKISHLCEILFMPRIKSSENITQYIELTFEPIRHKILAFLDDLINNIEERPDSQKMIGVLNLIYEKINTDMIKKLAAAAENINNNDYSIVSPLRVLYIVLANVSNTYPDYSNTIHQHLMVLSDNIKQEHGLYSDYWGRQCTLKILTEDEKNSVKVILNDLGMLSKAKAPSQESPSRHASLRR